MATVAPATELPSLIHTPKPSATLLTPASVTSPAPAFKLDPDASSTPRSTAPPAPPNDAPLGVVPGAAPPRTMLP